MKLRGLLLSAAVALTMAPPAMAERASDGNVSIIYWQAPSILNPYLSSGTKDIESSSLVIAPLGSYTETGAMVPYLAKDIPTVANGGVRAALTSITWQLTDGLTCSDASADTSADVQFAADYRLNTADGP